MSLQKLYPSSSYFSKLMKSRTSRNISPIIVCIVTADTSKLVGLNIRGNIEVIRSIAVAWLSSELILLEHWAEVKKSFCLWTERQYVRESVIVIVSQCADVHECSVIGSSNSYARVSLHLNIFISRILTSSSLSNIILSFPSACTSSYHASAGDDLPDIWKAVGWMI